MKNISVVIPTFNGKKLLEKHLPEVLEILKPGDEIIVVDDASTDDTVAWIQEQKPKYAKKNISLITVVHKQNQRFAAAVNSGVSAAQSDRILLLNNDVSPLSKDLREKLLKWFENKNLFSVGCAEVHDTNKNGQVFGRGTGGWSRGLLMHWYDKNQNSTQTLWTAGGSMMFDKNKFQEIGGLDTLFKPAYEEDRDLSYRALKHGWELAFDFDARVLHQHETTNESVFGQRKIEVTSWKNQFLLVWKNITDVPLLIQHLAWLPYHLTLTSLRTQGASLQGFWQALNQLDEALEQRTRVRSLWKKTDTELLSKFMEK